MNRRGRVTAGIAAGVFCVAGLVYGAPVAVASTMDADSSLVTGAAKVAEGNTGCPSSFEAVVPDRAAVKASGVKAILPEGTSADVIESASKNKLMQRIVADNPTWLDHIDCKAMDVHSEPAQSGSEISSGSDPFASCSSNCTSSNWSGYEYDGLDSNHVFYTLASQLWKVPAPDAPVANTTRRISIWPGIGSGKFAYDQLIQAGTETFSGPLGATGTYGWFESYPYQSEQQIGNLTIRANDDVYSIITYSGAINSHWTFDLCNGTLNVCASGSESFPAGGSNSVIGQTAEWIVERSGTPVGLSELGDFVLQPIQDAQGYKEHGGGTSNDFFAVQSVDAHAKAIRMTSCNGSTQLDHIYTIPNVDGTFNLLWDNYGAIESCP